MCLPFLNLVVRYDALLRGWCVAYVGDVSLFLFLLDVSVFVQMGHISTRNAVKTWGVYALDRVRHVYLSRKQICVPVAMNSVYKFMCVKFLRDLDSFIEETRVYLNSFVFWRSRNDVFIYVQKFIAFNAGGHIEENVFKCGDLCVEAL
jgi:hypothetical protein